jgi:hypothetical protein
MGVWMCGSCESAKKVETFCRFAGMACDTDLPRLSHLQQHQQLPPMSLAEIVSNAILLSAPSGLDNEVFFMLEHC